jgi:hypothetical protein
MADERPPVEPLTPEELERFLAQARAQGRLLTAEERAQIFGNSQSASATTPVEPAVSDSKILSLNWVNQRQCAHHAWCKGSFLILMIPWPN